MKSFTWNADQEVLGKVKTTRFGVGWRNYLDSGLWLPINTEIQNDRTVTAFPGNVQFPTSSQGWSSIVCDHKFSIRGKLNNGETYNAEPEFRMDMQVSCQHNVAGTVNADNPSQMDYVGAWDTADLLLGVRLGRAARIEKIVRVNSMPSGDGDIEYEFKLRSSHAKVFAGKNLNRRPWRGASGDTASLEGAPAYISRQASPIRGMLLKTPICWWFENGEKVIRNVAVRFVVESDQETVTVTKSIPREYATQAFAAGSALYTDATFSPDASPETTTVDGDFRQNTSNQTWTDKISAVSASSVFDSSTFALLGLAPSSLSAKYSEFQYPAFGFDTSSIGESQQVDSASFDVFTDNDFPGHDDLGLLYTVYGQTLASNTQLATTDYDGQSPSTAYCDTPRVLLSESSTGQYVTHTFNEAGKLAINLTDVTNLCLCLAEARENGTYGDPTWSGSGLRENRLILSTAETSGTSSDPVLTVEHSEIASETQSKTMLKRILK